MARASLIAATVLALLAVRTDLVAWAAVPVLLAAYWCGLGLGRRALGLIVGPAAVGFVVTATLVQPRWWAGLAPMVLAALLAGAAFGHAVRNHRALAAAAQERARHEERLRLARDVHDLVAHHLAVVNVHAGVAGHLLPERPDQAATALGHVRRASSNALDELAALLGALREPTPGLAQLGRLLEPADTLTVLGSPGPVPATVGATGYRIAQEALTNARRHGAGPARLTLTYEPERLLLDCRNRRSGGQTAGPGHGLRGMRERVALLGGELATGPEGLDFVVRATLPRRGAR